MTPEEIYAKYINFIGYLNQLANCTWSDAGVSTFNYVMSSVKEHLPKEEAAWKQWLLPYNQPTGNLDLPPDLLRLLNYKTSWTCPKFTQAILEFKKEQPKLAQLIVELVGPKKVEEVSRKDIVEIVQKIGLETIKACYPTNDEMDMHALNVVAMERDFQQLKLDEALNTLPDEELKPLYRVLRYIWLFTVSVQVPEEEIK